MTTTKEKKSSRPTVNQLLAKYDRLEGVTYVVKRPFKYGDKHYERGDHFKPEGFPTDPRIIERLCHEQREVIQ